MASAAGDLEELHASFGLVLLGDRLEGVRVRQNLAVLEELGTCPAAEGSMLAPLLVERDNLGTFLDRVELADAHVPAERPDLAGKAKVLDGPVGVLGPDVDVLDELDRRVAGDECLVGVIRRGGV